ncbi:MAG: ABC transporter permease subunit [Candidatus Hydrogenedentota bacterium]|nr:MAG: ABC transporter permease subunit [Candidatus Hydrogenedentota bacterium]
MIDYFQFILSRLPEIGWLTVEHIRITLISVALAIAIGVPLGIVLVKARQLAAPVIGATSVIQTIPSLALLGFMIPLLGIGIKPAIVALFLYALLPIVRNTFTGIDQVDPTLVEAGKGMGMTGRQILRIVQIPLSLPVIMAGIRTSAVINVGVATLCALIGAGGLGELIFRGIAMVNSQMILAGALPAAILALVFDGVLGLIEKGLTTRKRTSLQLTAGLALSGVLVLTAFVPSGFGKKSEEQIIIGSKEFTEQLILGEIMAQLIESKTDASVVRKFGLGGTMVCFNALRNGEIDLYPEYTGTGLTAILNRKFVTDPDTVYQLVSEEFEENLGLIWLHPFSFNNTYALAMRNDHAEKLNMRKISDLSRRGLDLVPGFTQEFLERPDGYPGLARHYSLEFTSEPKGMDPGLMYIALREGDVDLICAFATDGRIPAFNLRVLEDDRHYFPPYHAAPVVREETLMRVSELGSVLNELAGLIDDQRMAELNYQVDEEGQSPEQVALEFLRSAGLVETH